MYFLFCMALLNYYCGRMVQCIIANLKILSSDPRLVVHGTSLSPPNCGYNMSKVITVSNVAVTEKGELYFTILLATK